MFKEPRAGLALKIATIIVLGFADAILMTLAVMGMLSRAEENPITLDYNTLDILAIAGISLFAASLLVGLVTLIYIDRTSEYANWKPTPSQRKLERWQSASPIAKWWGFVALLMFSVVVTGGAALASLGYELADPMSHLSFLLMVITTSVAAAIGIVSGINFWILSQTKACGEHSGEKSL